MHSLALTLGPGGLVLGNVVEVFQDGEYSWEAPRRVVLLFVVWGSGQPW